QRAGALAGGEQIAGDGGGEPAGVRQDGDRSLLENLAGVVAAKRATNAHPVPGISHPQAVTAEDVDASLLAESADLARVVDRELLGDDEDLPQLGVQSNQLGNSVASRGGRQIDHPAVEAVARVHSL